MINTKVFIVSDTHFYHSNIIKGMSEWGFRDFKNVKEMNETMIERWNSVVSDDDMVIHLGDFALCKPREIEGLLKRLNGRIFVIKGNHDNKNKLKRYGVEVFGGVMPVNFKYKGRSYDVALRHKPEDVKDYNVIIHGHSHENYKVKIYCDKIYINMSVEQWDYYPVNVANIVDYIITLEEEITGISFSNPIPLIADDGIDEYQFYNQNREEIDDALKECEVDAEATKIISDYLRRPTLE